MRGEAWRATEQNGRDAERGESPREEALEPSIRCTDRGDRGEGRGGEGRVGRSRAAAPSQLSAGLRCPLSALLAQAASTIVRCCTAGLAFLTRQPRVMDADAPSAPSPARSHSTGAEASLFLLSCPSPAPPQPPALPACVRRADASTPAVGAHPPPLPRWTGRGPWPGSAAEGNGLWEAQLLVRACAPLAPQANSRALTGAELSILSSTFGPLLSLRPGCAQLPFGLRSHGQPNPHHPSAASRC